MPALTLRPYQDEALSALALARGADNGATSEVRRALVVLATGLGKTLIMASIPKALGLRAGESILILAHREELIEQTVEKVRMVDSALTIGVEKAERFAPETCDVIVGSVQTLKGKRLDHFVRRFARTLAVIAIDEAHHAVAAGYNAIVNAFPGAFVVGVTATPKRGDSVGLADAFDKIIIHRDLHWGIDQGYLVPLRSYVARSEVDLSDIASRARSDGGGVDYSDVELARRVNQEARNQLIVKTYMQHVPDKKGLVFCASVEHARAVHEQFRRLGMNSAYASAMTSRIERVRIVDDFRIGKIQVLINCGLYTEGFDDPTVEVVVNGRPTKSPALYAQIVGRALRPLEPIAGPISTAPTPEARCAIIAASAKPSAIIIDVLDGGKLPPGLQTLPTLWGLPANLDLLGEDVREAVVRFEKVAARDPVLVTSALTIDDYTVVLAEIDPFAPPVPDPIVLDASNQNWLAIAGDAHRLTLPTAFVPVGTRLEDLSKARRDMSQRVKREKANGNYDPLRKIQLELGTSIATIEECVEVGPTVLNRWHATVHQRVYRDGSPQPTLRSRILADEQERVDAFHAADTWLRKNRRDALAITDRSAPWRSEPMSEAQKTMLLSTFAVPEERLPTTRGLANDLIERLSNEEPLENRGKGRRRRKAAVA